MRRQYLVALLISVGIVVGAVVLWLRAASTPDREPPQAGTAPAEPATFVGVEVCRSCHVEEFRRWRGSDHDLAMDVAQETTVLGDFGDATFQYFGATSTFFRRDGAFIVRTDGPDGALADYEVAYTFGFYPLQQYLIRFPGGRLQALGIAWDARPREEGGQRWFHLYPDEQITHDDILHWTRPEQTWNYMCAECHSTHLEKNYRAAEDRYETTWAEIDVSCEACHGPGSAHVVWARGAGVEDGTRGASAAAGLMVGFDDGEEGRWVFDAGAATARRTRARASDAELDACGRCHSRRSVIGAPYVHGRPLMDTHRPQLLDEGLYHADGQILDEVYVYGSFLQSKMHARGVTCSDCHDPHALAIGRDPDDVCGRCHRPERFRTPEHHFHPPGSEGASCVACHMRARTYMVVDPRRDHSFRVPRPDLSAKLDTPNACTDCHRDRPADWAAGVVAGWYGGDRAATPHFGEALHAGRRGLPGAERQLAQLATDATQPAIARASALDLLANFFRPASMAAVEIAVRDEDPLVRAAAAGTLDAAPPRRRMHLAKDLIRDPIRGVRIEAAPALASVPAHLWNAADRAALQGALEEYRAAQWINADRPEAHLNLGLLHVAVGEIDQAHVRYENAIRLAPYFVPAYVNLADIYRQQGRDEDGERFLREALEVAPDSADVHHALGLLLVRRQRRAEAVDLLRKAAELDPDQPHHAYVYGVALHSGERTDEALRVLRQAHERHPYDRELLVGLATISGDSDALPEAIGYAKKLLELSPTDVSVRALLEELEARRLRRPPRENVGDNEDAPS